MISLILNFLSPLAMMLLDHFLNPKDSIISSALGILKPKPIVVEEGLPMNAFLSALGPILGPVVIQAYQSELRPAIVSEIAKISSADLQVVANSFLAALDNIVTTEAPKL